MIKTGNYENMAELTMLKICYILANLCEMTLGIVILNKIYPEFRFKSGVMKGLAIVLFCVAGFFNSPLFVHDKLPLPSTAGVKW